MHNNMNENSTIISTTKTISVFIADGHDVVRKGIRLLLNDVSNIQIIGEAKDGLTAKNDINNLKPDLILLDISLKIKSAFSITREILKQSPEMKIILLSTCSDDEYIIKALQSGAHGFILKRIMAHTLIQTITEVETGCDFFYRKYPPT